MLPVWILLLLTAIFHASASTSTSYSPSTSESTSVSPSTSYSASTSESQSASSSTSHSSSTSESTSVSLSTSYSASTSESTSVSPSTSYSASTSESISVSQSTSYTTSASESTSVSPSTSESASVSSSTTYSASTSGPRSVSLSTSYSASTSESISVSPSTSYSASTSESTSVSLSTSYSASTSESISVSSPISYSATTSESIGVSQSTSYTTSASESTSVSPSTSYSASTTESTSISPSTSYSTTTSESTSVSPSTSYSVSNSIYWHSTSVPLSSSLFVGPSSSYSGSASSSSALISSSFTTMSESQSVSTSFSTSLSTSPIVTSSSSSVSISQTVSTSFSQSLSTTQSRSVSESASLSISPTTSLPISMSSSVAPSNMYPYGLGNGDSEFRLGDSYYYYYGHCLEVKVGGFGFPFFGERHYKLHICRNGKIQLNYEWSFWWPQKFGVYRWFRNYAIIAPFWGLTDQYFAFNVGHSKVYYQVYSLNTNPTGEVLNKASQHVRQNDNSGKFSNFQAQWVLVVTWVNLCPYVYYPYWYYYWFNWRILQCPWSNTFQAVIITDFLNSFLMFNYPSGGIQWAAPVRSIYYRYWIGWYGIPTAGWNAGDGSDRNYVNMKGSKNLNGMFNLDKRVGNTGVKGSHFWRIENSDGRLALEKCFSWARLQSNINFLYWHTRYIRLDWRMACPCSGWQAWFDRRFIWNWRKYSWPDWCFESRRSRSVWYYTPYTGYGYFVMKQLCCYSTDWRDWASLKTGPPDGSRVQLRHYYSYYWWNRVENVYTDVQAYKYCCVDIPFCNFFYFYRPSDDCSRYIPPRRRWFWGDPHFKTLDGGNFTFNGLGEYVMIDAQNGTFQLLARTTLAQGNSTTATIFAAGAAKEENTSIVEVRVKKGGGIDVLIDHTIYSNYSSLTNDSVNAGGNLSISKPEENCLEVSFPSLTSVKFCEKQEMMSFVVTPGDDYKSTTKGLLGTWNDNPDDDFTLPDGTVLPSSLTLRDIHFRFGVKWQINQSQSLFTYAQNESVNTFSKPDFEPMFADNITWHNDSVREAAEAQCGDDHECLFDVASTNDLSVGMVTKVFSVQLVNETNTLDNFPPKIVNVPSEINATLHQTVQFSITAEDNDTITFRVINKPSNATVNISGNVLLFTWAVTTTKKFNLSFVATDDKGASATWSPKINMCACDHGGQCVPPEEGDKVNTDSKFVYMGCACQGGYTGRFCDSDIDACEMNGQPCYAGVNCTDLPPPANVSGYTCGPCPAGYTGNGAQCADLDECQSNQTNKCEQVCVNVPGSFTCDCNNGYKLNADGHGCDDINECEPTNDCMQKCNNTEGSYNCSCNEFFKTDPQDWRNCTAKNPCSPGHGCQHVCYTGAGNRPLCACYANYELQSDGKACQDINECDKSVHRCNQICENTPGSYKCSCQKGFELSRDGYTCEDINECVDEDLFSCPDEFQVCVNVLASYKCECGLNLYFIDGKCRGLRKNETAPIPKLENPRQPSAREQEHAVQITIGASNDFKWDFQTDKSFKEKTAAVTTSYCTENRTECALKEERRTRRAVGFSLYTADYVHLLPEYPSNNSGSFAVAFYVKQPPGLFVGNNSVLPSNTLVDIIVIYKSELESAIGASISDIKALFTPTTVTTTTGKPVEESENNNWKWIVIGVCIGVVVIILVIAILIWRRNKRKIIQVKPSSDDFPEEAVIMESYTRSSRESLKAWEKEGSVHT